MKKSIGILILGLALLWGCNAEQADQTESTGLMEQTESIEPSDYMALFQQELLFLQQGFRQHGVDGNYTVYFALPEEQSGQAFYQDMLLEGKEGYWREKLSYTYDWEKNWYTFSSQYEPVLTKDLFYVSYDAEAEEFKAGAVYQTEISADVDLEVPLRFDIPSEPVIYNQRREEGSWSEDLCTYVYVYQDKRLDFTVEIEYPQYSTYVDKLANVDIINQHIQDSFFYGYGVNEEEWNPAAWMYGEIYRNCEIMRMDDRYLSVCIYNYNSFRGANHPNEWKAGMTIDLTTGEILTLRDIIGPNRTVEELTDTGAEEAFFTEDRGICKTM